MSSHRKKASASAESAPLTTTPALAAPWPMSSGGTRQTPRYAIGTRSSDPKKSSKIVTQKAPQGHTFTTNSSLFMSNQRHSPTGPRRDDKTAVGVTSITPSKTQDFPVYMLDINKTVTFQDSAKGEKVEQLTNEALLEYIAMKPIITNVIGENVLNDDLEKEIEGIRTQMGLDDQTSFETKRNFKTWTDKMIQQYLEEEEPKWKNQFDAIKKKRHVYQPEKDGIMLYEGFLRWFEERKKKRDAAIVFVTMGSDASKLAKGLKVDDMENYAIRHRFSRDGEEQQVYSHEKRWDAKEFNQYVKAGGQFTGPEYDETRKKMGVVEAAKQVQYERFIVYRVTETEPEDGAKGAHQYKDKWYTPVSTPEGISFWTKNDLLGWYGRFEKGKIYSIQYDYYAHQLSPYAPDHYAGRGGKLFFMAHKTHRALDDNMVHLFSEPEQQIQPGDFDLWNVISDKRDENMVALSRFQGKYGDQNPQQLFYGSPVGHMLDPDYFSRVLTPQKVRVGLPAADTQEGTITFEVSWLDDEYRDWEVSTESFSFNKDAAIHTENLREDPTIDAISVDGENVEFEKDYENHWIIIPSLGLKYNYEFNQYTGFTLVKMEYTTE